MRFLKKALPVILLALCIICIGAAEADAAQTGHSHPICGSTCTCGSGHSAVTWQTFPQGNVTLSSGNYYLDSSYTLGTSDRIIINGPVSLCLNGNTLTETTGTSCISVQGSGSLTLCDCDGSGKITNTYAIGGSACVYLSDSSNMTVYSGTINGASFGGIGCYTTGDVYIRGGTVSGRSGGVDVYQVNTLSISGGTVTSSVGAAVECEYGTFNNISISGGYLEGKTAGVQLSQCKSTGTIRISGGKLNGKGPVPNATTYAADYYGLSFKSANLPACQVYITGGDIYGARGGVYNCSPNISTYISGGIVGNTSVTGVYTNAGSLSVSGGKVYGVRCETAAKVTVTNGEILSISLSLSSNGVYSTLEVWGGTIGKVGYSTASYGIHSLMSTGSQAVRIYGGTILGTDYAVRSLTSDGVYISGGSFSGGTADIYLSQTGTTASNASLSLRGYNGEPLTVAPPYNPTVGNYIAKNVSRADLITFNSTTYSALYDSDNSAVKINGAHTHTYSSWVSEKAATCTATGTLGYKKCTICYQLFNADGEELTDLVIPVDANNHTRASTQGQQAATCTEGGYAAGVYCNACAKWLVEPTAVPALGHDYSGEQTTVTPPTCDENGSAQISCIRCDSTQEQALPATGHSYENGICIYCQAADPDFIKGDLNGDGRVSNNDVVLLLWHILFPEDHPLDSSGDMNGDSRVSNIDVVLLLWHALFPENFPL